MKNILSPLRGAIPLSGGLRKRCFKIKDHGKTLVYCLWPKESLPKKKILETIKLEALVREKGFPVRQWKKLGRSWIKEVCFEDKDWWLGIGTYLAGAYSDRLTREQIFEAGKMLAQLHHVFKLSSGKTLLHLDFARRNILFDEKGRVVGILDFEEARWGEPEKDLASSLSFFCVDCPYFVKDIWKSFLSGYHQNGGSFKYDKIESYFFKFLMVRMNEGNKEAFLLLAKKRLEDLQRKTMAKLLAKSDLGNFFQKNKKKKRVFCVGAFDLLHWGHIQFLEDARKLGDLLVVGVASDQSRRRLKGEPHPLITAQTRAETLAYFKAVDAVVILDEDNVKEELKLLKPKIFYTVSRDWKEGVRKPEEKEIIKSYGGFLKMSAYHSPAMSSVNMIEKIALLKIKQVLFSRIKRQPILKVSEKKIPGEIKFADLGRLSRKLNKQGKTVVFTSLTADLFHLGHARFIQKAKSLGDFLVVGIPSNESVTALKGPGRPMIDERARALVLAKLEDVDSVVIFDERTVLKCLENLKPAVFFTVKEEWNEGFATSPEAQFMKSIGGKIVRSERQAPYLSASKIIDKAAGELIQKKFSDLISTARETPVLDADGFDPHSPQAQLKARENGLYEQVLQAVAQRGKCVFCDLKEKYLICEKDGLVLTVALFPYIDGHLLVIPRRHIELVEELSEKEERALFSLVRRGREILKEKLGVEKIWFLLREGKGAGVGKSVDHLHFHLLPYDPEIVKMGVKKLSMTPLEIAQKLRK